jgi:pimeloyl-ACP methyl ester carboxylesterase
VKRANQARDVKAGGLKQFTEGFVKAVLHEKTFESNPKAVEYIRSSISSTPPEVIAGTLIALAGRTDTSPSLFELAIPTLILVGRHDALTPPSASQAMKEKIKGSEMHLIPDAGHVSNMENPEEFTTHLFNFLHKVRRTP